MGKISQLGGWLTLKTKSAASRIDPLCVLILGLAVGLWLLTFIGASHEDDLGFTGLAKILAFEHGWPHHHQSIRIFNFMPIALAYWLNGEMSLFSTHIYHFSSALIMLLTVYLVGRRIEGRSTGLIGMIYLALIPLHVVYASRVMPSIPESAWGGLGIMSIYFAELNPQNKRRLWSYLFCGILIGCAYLTRETAAVLLGAPLGYLFLRLIQRQLSFGRALAFSVLVMLGFLLVFFFECLAYYLHAGDWMLKWKMAYAGQNNPAEHFPQAWAFYFLRLLNLESIKFAANDRDLDFSFAWIHPYFSMLGFTAVFIPVAFVSFVRQKLKDPAIIVAFWMMAYFLFLSFGSASFSHYNPIRKFDRYQILYLSPMAIIGGWYLVQLWNQGVRARIFSVALGLLVVISGAYHTNLNYKRYAAYRSEAFGLDRLFMRLVKKDTVKMELWYCAVLDYLHSYNTPYTCQNIGEMDQDPNPARWVVIRYNDTLKRYETMHLPASMQSIFQEPPSNWEKMAEVPANVMPWEPTYRARDILFYVH